jgi:hypothetical protein
LKQSDKLEGDTSLSSVVAFISGVHTRAKFLLRFNGAKLKGTARIHTTVKLSDLLKTAVAPRGSGSADADHRNKEISHALISFVTNTSISLRDAFLRTLEQHFLAIYRQKSLSMITYILEPGYDGLFIARSILVAEGASFRADLCDGHFTYDGHFMSGLESCNPSYKREISLLWSKLVGTLARDLDRASGDLGDPEAETLVQTIIQALDIVVKEEDHDLLKDCDLFARIEAVFAMQPSIALQRQLSKLLFSLVSQVTHGSGPDLKPVASEDDEDGLLLFESAPVLKHAPSGFAATLNDTVIEMLFNHLSQATHYILSHATPDVLESATSTASASASASATAAAAEVDDTALRTEVISSQAHKCGLDTNLN